MNILKVAVLFGILLKCVAASESNVKDDVIEALGENEFEGIKRDWEVGSIARIYLIMWL